MSNAEKLNKIEKLFEDFCLSQHRENPQIPVSAFRKALWLDFHPEYEEAPATFREFCLEPEYLGIGEDVYRSVLDLGDELTSKNYLEVVLLMGIGSGKSFFSQVLMAYYTHLLLCLKDPHLFFGLSKDKPITIINMGLNASQAKKVVFTGAKNLIKNSHWFQNCKYKKKFLESSLTFSTENYDVVRIESGNAQENAPIGVNLFLLILDEAAFYLDNVVKSQAQVIYDTAKARIISRFGAIGGMIVMISSPRYEKDFISQKFAEGKQYPDKILVKSAPTWKMKDREKLSDDCFVFDVSNLKILETDQYKTNGIPHPLEEHHKKELKFASDDKNKNFWIIPNDYKDSFQRRPEKAVRDLGALPTSTIEPFIKLPEHIDKVMTIENGVDENGIWKVEKPSDEPLYIHIDLGLNRNGRGDCAGIAAARLYGNDKNGLPIVKVEFAERITAGDRGEIQFAEVRQRIFDLLEAGWIVNAVSLDSFQSVDTIQILKSQGIRAEYLSVDTSAAPYETLRDCIYDSRVLLPKNDFLKTELKELERVKGGKVDHPSFGSKDLADAVAGAVYSCMKYESEMGDITSQLVIGKRR